jgi:hypothetical protein
MQTNPEQEFNDMKKIFSGLEDENLQETIQDHSKSGKNVSYTQLAKLHNGPELTDERISDLVDMHFPLFGKAPDITKEEKTQRTKARSKFKEALLKRREDFEKKHDKQPRVYVPENQGDEESKEKYIEQIKKLDKDIPDDMLQQMDGQQLEELLGGAIDKNLGPSEEMYANGLYRLLCGTASVMDAQPYTEQQYGISFKGVHEIHIQNEEELKGICQEILIESPELKKYLSPNNRLLLLMTQIYGGVALANLKKPTKSTSGTGAIPTESK